MLIYPPAPACQGPSGREDRVEVTDQRFSDQICIGQVTSLELSSDLRSASPGLVGCRDPWTSNLPPSTSVPSIWGGSGEILKINEISSNLQYPKNHQISLPRPPKVSKMKSKQGPEIIRFMKKSKK